MTIFGKHDTWTAQTAKGAEDERRTRSLCESIP